ncbi:MAG: PrsW family intramembrane metalloprotease [Anaerolineaceae bacterium]|nr:PrsW family intramembrane metalloprotease [Anaerolineaceae bacterium]
MITAQPVKKFDLPAFLMLLLSGVGVLGGLAISVGLVFTGVFALVTGGVSGGQALPIFSLAWSSFFFVLLLLPSLVNAFIRLLELKQPLLHFPHHLRLASLCMTFFPALVILGHYLTTQSTVSWLLLPPLQTVAVLIPIWWVFEVGRRGLVMGERRQGWNLISFNFLISQPIIITAELILIVFLAGLAGLWLAGHPKMFEELLRLAHRINDAGMDTVILQRILLSYLGRPVVLLGILVVAAGLIPLLEELLKPLALWGLAGRHFTPVDGFVGGMLCGATFALMETLGNLTSPTEAWTVIMVGRLGTAVLHITASGLVGWGLASALGQGKYIRLGAIYLISVSLHALWNIFGMLAGIAPLLEGSGAVGITALSQRLGGIAPSALTLLTITMFLILLRSNHSLRKTAEGALSLSPAGGETP